MSENQQAENRHIASVSTLTIIKVVAVFLGLYFLFLIRDIVLLLVISVILAAAISPLVEWLYTRGRFPRGLTVVLVYIVFISFVVLVFSLLLPKLAIEVVSLGNNIRDIQDSQLLQSSGFHEFLSRLGLSNMLQNLGLTLSGLTETIFQRTLGVFSGIFDVISVLVISFYLVIQQDGMNEFAKSLAPAEYHARIGSVVSKVQNRLGKWLLGQLALMFSIFLMTYIGLSILHIKYSLVLALLAGLLEIVPYVGPILSAVPAILIALLQSPLVALIVVALYTFIQQSENYLLVPKIIGKSIGANPLVILIALLVGFKIAGILGMLIAAPLVAVGAVIMEDYDGHRKSKAQVA
ncbi:MAG: AI-2E family transporter [Patescibacteria group bacterium]|nr:AI-2E family transporter [Patescibacteria group bacterium]